MRRFATESVKAGENVCIGKLMSVTDAKLTIPQDTTANIVFHVTSEADVIEIEEWLVSTCDKGATDSARTGLPIFLAGGPETADGARAANFLMGQSTHINHTKRSTT